MVYANANMLTVYLEADRIEEHGEIWLANYTTNTTYQNDFQYWQYSSKGYIDGIIQTIQTKFSISGDILNTAYWNHVFNKGDVQVGTGNWG